MQLVIFDWEGTLVKDMDTQFECLLTAAKNLGLKLKSQYKLFSSPWHFLDSPVNGLTNLQSAQLRQAFSMRLSEFEKVSDETLAVLKSLQQRGILLGVATNLNRESFERVLAEAGIGDMFTATATPTEYNSKPAPDMLNGVVKELNASKDYTLFVGDSATDIEAANAANVKSCWLTTSEGLKPEPTYWLPHMRELLSLECFK